MFNCCGHKGIKDSFMSYYLAVNIDKTLDINLTISHHQSIINRMLVEVRNYIFIHILWKLLSENHRLLERSSSIICLRFLSNSPKSILFGSMQDDPGGELDNDGGEL